MPLWGNTDATAQSAIFAPAQFRVAPNTANRDALYGNTTADAFVTGETIGQYGVSVAEMRATRADKEARPAHAGWVLRTEGTGGRAGRIKHEVLVAGHLTGDGENTAFQDYAIVITGQPEDATGNSTADDVVVFTVVAATVPTGKEANVVYTWYWSNTSVEWEALPESGAYSDVATDVLSVDSAIAPDAEVYRVELSSPGAEAGANDYSGNATLTVTT
jgi:hypothetical protein